ncbi:glycosyltransferase family 2 protein [Candidatus Peribacteria bacterium]|jgi:dolichol-phosphate mannosyltransferase|nr:glycosyltransferase family 2 protein [Candidatus Peribacteria bacterium]MBT4021185.1 glycosyltransferase family 2 protein [Candidatus Peribacteria bacterium]MBT4240961.1 glycosyltransferase family 2 protein [Candidatus Peribacteria bacterium]MBT4474605.1 glycosyltransferase family 2 protein [Candidatus Peribacteria bacterium]
MKELSILIPVYNEEKTVAQVMRTVGNACPEAQIIYIDDGSHDSSLEILKQNAREQDLVLTKPNGGKGSAIRMGLEHSTGKYSVIQDADLEYEPSEMLLLLKEAKEKNVKVVFGSRFMQKNPRAYLIFLMGNKVLSLIISILFFKRITDSYTCYKLLDTNLFKSLNLKSNGFEMEAEICAKCLKLKEEILEVPISYNPRTIEEGKKINWKDAVKGILMMLKIRVGISASTHSSSRET